MKKRLVKGGKMKLVAGHFPSATLNESAVSPSIKRLSPLANAEILYKLGGDGVYKVKP
jgi:hypothetical protein